MCIHVYVLVVCMLSYIDDSNKRLPKYSMFTGTPVFNCTLTGVTNAYICVRACVIVNMCVCVCVCVCRGGGVCVSFRAATSVFGMTINTTKTNCISVGYGVCLKDLVSINPLPGTAK